MVRPVTAPYHDHVTSPVRPSVVRTACRICAVGCGTLVELDGATVRRVSGDPDDPWSKGYLCGHGRAAPAYHHASDRLDVPLMRRDGELVEVTWDEALDDVAARIRALIDEHGPSSIVSYTGTGGPLDPTGYAMAHGFFRALGAEHHYSALSIDCPGKFLVPELVAGVQLPFHPDLERTGLLIAIGVNTVVSHGHGIMVPNPIGHLRELRSRGARFVVVDPRRTESAHHADLHVAVRPGSDPALLAFLVRHVLARGGDAAFLDACAEPDGLARLRALVGPFDAVRAAQLCGVAQEQLVALAAMVDDAGRVAIETGTGVSMGRSGNVTEWLVWALAAVTGSLDRPGGVVFNPGFLRATEDALPRGRGDLLPGPASRPDLPRIVNGEMPCTAMADEIEAGHVRAMIVRLGNPAMAIPEPERLDAALRSLPLLVVLDTRLTATAAAATHVLPMADHFERSDLLNGYLQALPFLRHAPAVVEPIGARRPQWWVFAELSRRLGLPRFGSGRADALLTEATQRSEEDPQPPSDVVHGVLARSARRPWAEVVAAPYGIRDESVPPGWLVPGRLTRPLDLAPVELAEQLTERLAAWDAAPVAPGEVLLVNRRTAKRYNSFTPRTGDDELPDLEVHPDDAVSSGLSDGARCVVRSAAGACEARVVVTDRMRAGYVSMPHGSGRSNVNLLTTTAGADRRSGMPVLSGVAVRLEPALR